MFKDLYMKVLRYASALPFDASINPKANIVSAVGFNYPELAKVLGDLSYLDAVVLAKLEERECLIGDFEERVLLCPYCSVYNMCFRDTCAQCSYSGLKVEAMIHHFRCAYMGAEREFKHGNSWDGSSSEKKFPHHLEYSIRIVLPKV
jgi:hypothetical protein